MSRDELAPRQKANGPLTWVLLLALILVGGYLRFMSPNWDEFTLWHPDERHMTQVQSSLGGPLSFTDADVAGQYARCLERYPATGGVGGFFDAECSNWNPNNTGNGLYVYGTLPQFAARALAETLSGVTGDANWLSYYGVRQSGRLVSALAEMCVIVVTFLIGRALHGRWVGLLAAALYTFAVFGIQQAHFFTADATANFFVALTILWAVRIQQQGRLLDYLLAGLAIGAAAASRVNTAPVAGLVALAMLVQLLPLLDARLPLLERGRRVTQHLFALGAAALLALLAFRLLQPYAFNGPGFFGLIPNPRWLQDMAEAQHLVSGNAESPPNWQWVARTPYLFPLNNMLLWGMGLALGLTGWAAWLWSGWRLLRSRPGALANLILVVWVLVYFGWFGRLWVMSMRYYLPLYPALAVLAAWGLVELIRHGERHGGLWRQTAARALTVFVLGFTVLWALMFTNIYRQMFAPAQSSHWMARYAPADFALIYESGALINIPVANRPNLSREPDETPLIDLASRFEAEAPLTLSFTVPSDGVLTHIHSPHLGDPFDDPGSETVRVRIGVPDSNLILAEGVLTADLERDVHPLGAAYDIPLNEPLSVRAGESFDVTIEALEGGPFTSAGAVVAWEGDWDEVTLPKVCALPSGGVFSEDMPPGVTDPRLCSSINLWDGHLHPLRLQSYYEESAYKRTLMQRALDESEYLIISTNRRYDSQSRIPYRWPMTLDFYDALFSGQLGYELVEVFHETFEFGPLRVSDQVLPTYGGPAWLNEFEAEEAFHVYDHPAVMVFRKTTAYSPEMAAAVLSNAPLARVEDVTTMRNCGAEVLDSIRDYRCDPALIGVVGLYSVPASRIPTALQFPPDIAQMQREGGTWSERFDSDNPVNTQPIVTILVWWLVILVYGWLAWPLLFALLPGLADRGYTLAKVVGLVLVGWLTWFVASARLPVWSREGIIAAMGVVGLLSLAAGWSQRRALIAYVRQHASRLLWIEAITLAAFAFGLAVRLVNPDLWHPFMGGEKPMDFAYFNGVLRSTVFPPIDPWHAGGFINYYYFGYVIVGSPVLLLGMLPSIAYNLIVPTLLALTGIGAFGVAFNLVAAVGRRNVHRARAAEAPTLSDAVGIEPVREERLGSPWLAGMAALLLAVVLGNLDTPRVFLAEGVLRAGYFGQPNLLEIQLSSEYRAANGADPTGDALAAIQQRAQDEARSPLGSFVRGFSRVLFEGALDVAPNRWYWAPTRIIQEAPDQGGNAIAEFPFFTFLYGDLHAHMIAMPMLFIVMAFLLSEVLVAGSGRQRWQVVGAILLGGLTAGLLRATNTWDWITFMILGVLGLGFVWWLTLRRWGRTALMNLIASTGLFVAASFGLILPYTTWYASIYSSASFSDLPRTHLWMYFTIFGLFLFLLTTVLIVETGRWLRSVYVRDLRGQAAPLAALLAILGGGLVLSLVLATVGIPLLQTSFGTPVRGAPAAIIVLPLLLWIGLLFFRQGQSAPMRYFLALAGLALALTLGVDFVVLDGDVGRQNTVFKFYLQAWLLLSVVGGAALAWLVRASRKWAPSVAWGWYPALALLVFAAALYPYTATRGRSQDRFAPEPPLTLNDVPLTLDGMAYMQYGTLFEGNAALLDADPSLAPFPLADDYQIIRWLQENVQGTPVIMEGQSDREYRWQSRISIYTGLPSVNGWNFHQRQQRTFDPLPRLVEQRVANVNAFYGSEDIASAVRILQHYGVRYVILSHLERAYYPAASLAKFETMVEQGLLTLVFQHGEGRVYEVNAERLPPTGRDVLLAP